MLKWLRSTSGERSTGTTVAAGEPVVAVESLPSGEALENGTVSEAVRRFLVELATKEEPSDPARFSPEDQVLLSAIVRQQAENKLHVPMLPRVAMEITE